MQSSTQSSKLLVRRNEDLMQEAIYPVIGKQSCFPFYLTGVGISSPENHIIRPYGLLSHQILFTREGEGQFYVGDQSLRLKEGYVFYIMPGIPHEYYPVDGKWTTNWVVFRGNNLQQMMQDLGFPSFLCRKAADIQPIQRLFENIYASAGNPVRGNETCSLLIYEYIMAVRRVLLFVTDNTCSNRVIEAGLIFMNEHYDRNISLGELASLCHISPQHFCRVFRMETGMRPMEYLTRKRMLEAKVLLCNTKQSVAEISRQTGYEDPAYFGMVFKKYEGMSPGQYRKTKTPVIC